MSDAINAAIDLITADKEFGYSIRKSLIDNTFEVQVYGVKVDMTQKGIKTFGDALIAMTKIYNSAKGLQNENKS